MNYPSDPPMYQSLFPGKAEDKPYANEIVNGTRSDSDDLNKSYLNEVITGDNSSPTHTVEDAVESAGLGRFQLKLFVLCGAISAADAMEMLLLSVLGPALRCYWLLSSGQVAALTTVVFAGFLFGAPLWGFIADRFGRWPTLLIVLSMITYFGIITSCAPTYIWVIILRFLVGFAIGGGNSSFTLFSEFLTVKHRAKVLLAFNIFWAFGSTFEVALAYVILPRFGWRWLVFASALPLFIFLFLLRFLPESPRFLVGAGKTEEAERIIADLFRTNRVAPLSGTLVSPTIPTRDRGSIKGMFGKTYLISTLMLPIIWFSAAFVYYGVVLLSAEIFRFKHSCFGKPVLAPNYNGVWGNSSFLESTLQLDNSCCKELSDDDYVAMLVSSVGEFVSIPLMILMVDCVGRKITLASWNGLIAVIFMLLYLCMPKSAITALLFVLRALSAGLFSLAYVYTTEVSLCVAFFESYSSIVLFACTDINNSVLTNMSHY
ncbi:Synaptic vesicle 2-related protein [Schistosoma japonicum]|nr:Synaptic vesicle 2-related protein [Schistosoma japonicum]